ncbi:MAG TPA: c-type cytochrome [Cytophagaceae bacterium]|jgi:cytochrome c
MIRIIFPLILFVQGISFTVLAQQKPTAPKQSVAKPDGAKLIANSDCFACHDMKDKKVGPPYLEIAKKYTLTPQNIDNLSNKIIKGGKGVWGEIPMSPHPSLKKEEASGMAKYIIGLDSK